MSYDDVMERQRNEMEDENDFWWSIFDELEQDGSFTEDMTDWEKDELVDQRIEEIRYNEAIDI